MELLDLSNDVLRQIMIYYIDNSKVNQKKIKLIGSQQLNGINEKINIREPKIISDFYCHSTVEINEDDNYVDDDGYTTLMYACSYGISDVALKLLDMSNSFDICKLKQVDKYGETALIIACQYRMSDVALKILNLKCNSEYIDKHGNTALIWACINRMSEVALKLLNMDCEPEQINKLGVTASIYAQQNGMDEVIIKIKSLRIT
jgi:ankyrin repeat protein